MIEQIPTGELHWIPVSDATAVGLLILTVCVLVLAAVAGACWEACRRGGGEDARQWWREADWRVRSARAALAPVARQVERGHPLDVEDERRITRAHMLLNADGVDLAELDAQLGDATQPLPRIGDAYQ